MLFLVVVFSFWSPQGTGRLDAVSALAVGLVLLFAFPSYSVYRAWRRGEVDLELTVRSKRTRLYEEWMLWQLAAFGAYWLSDARALAALALASAATSAGLYVLNRYAKVSLHSAVAASGVVVLSLAFGPSYAVFALYLLPVAWVRWRMGRHSLVELVLGALTGAVLTWLAYLVLFG